MFTPALMGSVLGPTARWFGRILHVWAAVTYQIVQAAGVSSLPVNMIPLATTKAPFRTTSSLLETQVLGPPEGSLYAISHLRYVKGVLRPGKGTVLVCLSIKLIVQSRKNRFFLLCTIVWKDILIRGKHVRGIAQGVKAMAILIHHILMAIEDCSSVVSPCEMNVRHSAPSRVHRSVLYLNQEALPY